MTLIAEIPKNIPKPRLISVKNYEAMLENRILTENDNVELLNGIIIEKMPKGTRHSLYNDIISDILREKLKNVYVRNQNPILLDDFSQPEPDIVLAKLPREKYLERHPTPDDIFLVIEISDSTLYFDRDEKGAAYSRAGIKQYLIVNAENNTIEDYRNPGEDGFQTKQTYRIGENFILEDFPGI